MCLQEFGRSPLAIQAAEILILGFWIWVEKVWWTVHIPSHAFLSKCVERRYLEMLDGPLTFCFLAKDGWTGPQSSSN